jgi:hypothetical protein
MEIENEKIQPKKKKKKTAMKLDLNAPICVTYGILSIG